MSQEDDPYRRPEPAPRGSPQLGDQPLEFSGTRGGAAAGPEGLGGWLILVGIAVCIAPVRLLAGYLQVFAPILRDGGWRVLFDDGTPPQLKALLWFEVIANPLMILAAVVLVGLFFLRSYWFPRLFIGFVLVNLLVQIVDLWLASGIPNDPAAGVQGQDTLQLVRSVVYGAIWIPYMLVSRRVRNTFGASDPERRPQRREPVFANPSD